MAFDGANPDENPASPWTIHLSLRNSLSRRSSVAGMRDASESSK
jgi:hypothetical protein